jgi:hypothetical protein
MRVLPYAAICCAAIAGLVSPSLAQEPPPNPLTPLSDIFQKVANAPDGWTRNMDGSYKQSAAGVLCPASFRSFRLGDVTGPSAEEANIVGLCRYRDDDGRTGAIRIRKFVDGWGSDLSTAENDKALMGPNPPPMLMRASIDRKTAASRLTVTTVRNGFLVDCSVAQVGHERPPGDFPLYCTAIP